ncbi:MAG: outer membrane protein transport protein, partial [Desulfobulbaceae bacterium]|nr:outer membrane protein transport protein [Desulfobulbaceae bacterium]
KEEQFLIPHLFAVSPKVNNFRFGLALTSPAGLSKRWQDAFPRTSAEDFSLRVLELNPSVAWQGCEKFSLAAGVRLIRADGEARSYGTVLVSEVPLITATIRRDLEGNATEYGYNLAATFKPIQEWEISATYRSKVNLKLEGDATLWSDAIPAFLLPATTVVRSGSVTLPVPAVLTVGTAYTFDRTTVELDYNKTYWNVYENLDFNYNAPLGHPVLVSAFDDPKAKNWSDTNTYRIGVTHRCNDKWTAMLGFAIDENPVPDNTLGFEMPDSDAKIYSIGARYKYSDKLELGAAYLFVDKESRIIPAAAANSGTIDGTFDNSGAHLFSIGMQYNY